MVCGTYQEGLSGCCGSSGKREGPFGARVSFLLPREADAKPASEPETRFTEEGGVPGGTNGRRRRRKVRAISLRQTSTRRTEEGEVTHVFKYCKAKGKERVCGWGGVPGRT